MKHNDLAVYLSIYCPENSQAMAYSYSICNGNGIEIFENTGYFPASKSTSLITCLDYAVNDLEFDLILHSSCNGNEINSLVIATNYPALPHIMSGNIYIDSKLLNIESFKNCIKGLEGDFCNVQYIASPTDQSVTDRFYKAISLVIRNSKHKSFYDYSLGEFQIMAKADKEAFKQMIILENWNKIRVGKDTETKNKINFVQGLMAPEKKMNIQATLNFLDSFNTN